MNCGPRDPVLGSLMTAHTGLLTYHLKLPRLQHCEINIYGIYIRLVVLDYPSTEVCTTSQPFSSQIPILFTLDQSTILYLAELVGARASWPPEQQISGHGTLHLFQWTSTNDHSLVDPRVYHNPSQSTTLHHRSPLRNQHPRMALHSHRSPCNTL